MALLTVLKWALIWAVATGAAYIVYKTAAGLVRKPNLRYYVWSVLRNLRNMYYRYHV